MRVLVDGRLMDVPMRVALIRDHVPPVLVLVVLTWRVPVVVRERRGGCARARAAP